MNKDEIIKQLRDMAKHPTVTLPRDCEALKAAADLLAQPEQERNFCQRCGKRLGKNDWDVHTCTPPQPEQEPVAMEMTAHRAAYFMERFKHEEKLLGPNEQAALDFVISMLEAQPEQAPVAMKFKIYKPTAPDPVRQGINNALLPWVYDQDRSSGFDASMWVTPVATLPPQRKPLTDEEITQVFGVGYVAKEFVEFVRAIEAAHGIIKE